MKEQHGQFIRIDWDDDSDVEYVRGHVPIEDARAAFERWGGAGCGDAVRAIKHRWMRRVPTGPSSEYDGMFYAYDKPSRGAFAVTELDVSGVKA